MPAKRTHLILLVATAALGIVLAIQVSWLIRTARVKEELFNEKANLVLSKTAEAFSSASGNGQGLYAGAEERRIVDSLLLVYMASYGITMDYRFELVPQVPGDGNMARTLGSPYLDNSGTYQACITDVPSGNRQWELKLRFPGKRQFILNEMGMPFITSVVLILLVLLLSWRTMLSLLRQKRIAEQTTDFLNNMTHEFNTPLTNIALAGRMLSRDPELNPQEKIAHYGRIILDENEKLRLQVEEVLGMSALERGDQILHRQPVNLHEIVNEATGRMQLQLEQAGAVLRLQLDATQPVIPGDRSLLLRAICNLLDNALKYSAEKPEIIIHIRDQGKYLALSVSDNGVGIEKTYQEKIFEKYFRVPGGNTHTTRGFGLGLAYVRKIAELHGGTITVQSEPGKGSIFTLLLHHA